MGKRCEKALASRLGGRRVGLMGKDDIDCGPFSIEVKSRKKFAGEAFLEQAERNAQPGKTPIAIVHIFGKQHSNDIVMIRLRDWEAWHGRTGEQRSDP